MAEPKGSAKKRPDVNGVVNTGTCPSHICRLPQFYGCSVGTHQKSARLCEFATKRRQTYRFLLSVKGKTLKCPTLRSRAVVAHQLHKLEVGGSSPSSATIVRRTLSAKSIEIAHSNPLTRFDREVTAGLKNGWKVTNVQALSRILPHRQRKDSRDCQVT